MNDDRQSITEEIKYVSFKLGNYKIRFNKKIFKYTLIIGVIIIIGLAMIYFILKTLQVFRIGLKTMISLIFI